MKILRFYLLTIVALMCCMGADAQVSEFEEGYLKYKIDLSKSETDATVTGYLYRMPADVVIPDTVNYNGKTFNVTAIGERAFYGCTGLRSIDLGKVTKIEDGYYSEYSDIYYGAFRGCICLTSIDLKNVTTIGKFAFSCTGLTSLDLKNVTTIGSEAFNGCNSLTSIDFKNVETIGDWAFGDCTGFTTIDLKNVTAIGRSAFYSCTGLTSIDFKNVETIGGGAFYGCTGLRSIDLGKLTKIEDGYYSGYSDIYYGTFSRCTGLTSIDFKNVTTIGEYAFDGCSSLKSIELKNVETIHPYSFKECNEIKEIRFSKTNVPNIDNTSFNDIVYKYATLFVPKGSKQNYSSDQTWSRFEDIKEISYDFEVNGLYYKIDIDKLTDVIVVRGGSYYEGNIVIPETVEYNGKSFNVTSIDNLAFQYCTGLTSIDFGNVTNIGDGAFRGCTSLTSIDLKNVTTIGDGAFRGCTSLTSIDFGNLSEVPTYAFDSFKSLLSVNFGNIQTIGNKNFEGCTGLTSIDLNNVETIGDGAFIGCTGLTSIDLKNVTTIGNKIFYGCTGLTSIDFKNVNTIGSDAFSGCTGLTSIDFKNVNTIGFDAFYGCTGLASIDLKNVTTIGDFAFSCTNLTSIDLKNVTAIGRGAFYRCTGLTSIDFKNVETIGGGAFYGCTGLRSIDLGKLTKIEDGYYSGYSDIYYGTFSRCTGLTSIDFKNVTTIGSYAFSGCTGLTSIDLKNVNTIGSYAFSGCTGLTSIALGKITDIPADAFSGCTSLASIDFGKVESIKQNAFENFTTLTSINLRNVKSIGNEAFKGCDKITDVRTAETEAPNTGTYLFDAYVYAFANLYVPVGSKDKYANHAVWGKFSSIEEYKSDPINKILSVTVSEGGSVSFDGITVSNGVKLTEVPYGAQVVLTFTANDFYKLSSVIVNGKDVTADVIDNTYTVTMDKDIEVVAKFEENKCTLSVTASEGGSVSFNGITASDGVQAVELVKGEQVTMTISPDNGYRIDYVKVDGVDVTSELKDDTYTVTMNDNVNVEVMFAELPIYLTIQQAESGSIEQVAEKGKAYTFKINVTEGWKINTVTFNGTDVTSQLDANNGFTTPAITENSILNVSFEYLNSAISEVMSSDIRVSAYNSMIIIEGVNDGTHVAVYTQNGALVASQVSNGADMKITAEPGQVYIVKAGNRTFKVSC